MNNDQFERDLQALSRASRRSDPTAAWKAEILERARAESGVASHRFLPPRWLACTWGAAWAAILILILTEPSTPNLPSAQGAAASNTVPAADTQLGEFSTLMAFQQRMQGNLDIP